jgi:hypothetical protein
MAPLLKEGKPLRREVKIYGIEGLVVVSIAHAGLELKAKGTKLGVAITWPELLGASATPKNVPSKFESRAYEFLVHQAKEKAGRDFKRLEKNIAKELQERQK